MDYTNFKVTELREKLRELGLPVSGVKSELIERLTNAGPQNASRENIGRLRLEGNNPTSSNSSKTSRFGSMTLPELKAELAKYKLPISCKRKEELVQRLESYFECQLTGPINFEFVGRRSIELLMVAEKPSMAQELSHVLAQGGRIQKSSCSNDAIPVYEFAMFFHDYAANVRMTSTLGHIFKQDFVAQINQNKVDELFDCEVVAQEADPGKKIPKMLAEIGKNADGLVLWLDNDLEGEAICFEVIDCVKNALKKPPSNNVMDVIYRAKFSSSGEAPEAINNLTKPNFRYHLAALAKHDLDLRIGVPFSRYQTSILRREFRDRDIPHLSFGPCQTPALSFCVQQYETVASYVLSYTSHIVISVDIGHYQMEISSDPIKNEKEAERIYQKLKDEQQLKVESVELTTHVKKPPKALNTVELLKDASKHFGIGPSEAMQAAESLYTSGLISYPRTETTKYKRDIDVYQRKNQLRRMLPSFPSTQSTMAIGQGLRGCDFGDGSIDWDSIIESDDVYETGDDHGDHMPIVPTGKPLFRQLSPTQKLIYELICRRFLASLMPEQRYHTEITVFSAANITFKRKIQRIDDYGYAKVIPWEKTQINRDIPIGLLSNNMKINIRNIKISKTKSTAPTLLSESELIEKMEKHSIGTDASISSHIQNICRRNYVKVNEETRTLEPTSLGVNLIKAYRDSIPALVATTLRAEFEKQIMRIAKGERDYDEARNFILNSYKEQFKLFKNNFHRFTKNFAGCFTMKVEDDYRQGGYRNTYTATSSGPRPLYTDPQQVSNVTSIEIITGRNKRPSDRKPSSVKNVSRPPFNSDRYAAVTASNNSESHQSQPYGYGKPEVTRPQNNRVPPAALSPVKRSLAPAHSSKKYAKKARKI